MEAPLRPSEVAATLGISTRQLERLFDRHMGTSPKRFATDLRLDRARTLLAQTEQTVAEIAMASGFGFTPRFSRAFRARFGAPPSSQRAWLG